jgi:hypothetical protein
MYLTKYDNIRDPFFGICRIQNIFPGRCYPTLVWPKNFLCQYSLISINCLKFAFLEIFGNEDRESS